MSAGGGRQPITLRLEPLTVALAIGLLVLAASTARKQEEETARIMQAWVGRHADELLARWGPPSRILEAEMGRGRIYVYEDEAQVVSTQVQWEFRSGDPAPSVTTRVVVPAQERGYAYRMFWVGPDARIVRVAWRGAAPSPRLPNLPPL